MIKIGSSIEVRNENKRFVYSSNCYTFLKYDSLKGPEEVNWEQGIAHFVLEKDKEKKCAGK